MDSCCGLAGGDVKETGTEMEPGAFGVDALGKETRWRPDCAPEERVKPRTGGPAARADPASRARPMAAVTRRRINRRLWRDGAREPRAGARAPLPARAPLLLRPSPAFPRSRRRPSAA